MTDASIEYNTLALAEAKSDRVFLTFELDWLHWPLPYYWVVKNGISHGFFIKSHARRHFLELAKQYNLKVCWLPESMPTTFVQKIRDLGDFVWFLVGMGLVFTGMGIYAIFDSRIVSAPLVVVGFICVLRFWFIVRNFISMGASA